MTSNRRPPAAQPAGDAELSAADRRRLASHGLTVEQVERQRELLRRPPPRLRLLRPCRPRDGVHKLAEDRQSELLELWRRAADEGRLQKLVPASGAATRMFAALRARAGDPPPGSRSRLERRANDDDDDAAAVLRLLDELPRLPFAVELEERLTAGGHDPRRLIRDGAYCPLLEALLAPSGMGYGTAPKALVAFHRYPWGPRTAFAEHLAESAAYLTADGGRCGLHFTIAPDDEPAFRAELEAARKPAAKLPPVDYEVGFSFQDPATDAVALDAAGDLARDADGAILLRPAGHGALLGNLARLGGDLVLVGNIDNVVPQWRQDPVVLWKRLLVGFTVRLEEELAGLRRRLDESPGDPATTAAALATLTRHLALAPPPGPGAEEAAAWVGERLRRPLRVCGVVAHGGEPGGGPYWVRDAAGALGGQIVEPPEVDLDDPEQRAVWESSTHFNPVNMVLSLRAADGRPHRLDSFVDEGRYLVTTRRQAGIELRVLERPGLWNGSMAGWNTAFVELPAATFNPVKTVFDLLRPEHQPPEHSS